MADDERKWEERGASDYRIWIYKNEEDSMTMRTAPVVVTLSFFKHLPGQKGIPFDLPHDYGSEGYAYSLNDVSKTGWFGPIRDLETAQLLAMCLEVPDEDEFMSDELRDKPHD